MTSWILEAQAPNAPAIVMKEHIHHLIATMTLLCHLTGRQVVEKEIPLTFHFDHGVKFTVEDRENPVEYFENYFDEEIIAYLKQTDFHTSFKTRKEKLCYHDHDYVNGRL